MYLYLGFVFVFSFVYIICLISLLSQYLSIFVLMVLLIIIRGSCLFIETHLMNMEVEFVSRDQVWKIRNIFLCCRYLDFYRTDTNECFGWIGFNVVLFLTY